MRCLKGPVCLLGVFILMFCSVGIVQAATASFNVDPGKEFVRTINLDTGDKIQISFNVLGGTSNELHFWILLPNATTMDYGQIGQCSTSFVTNTQGGVDLHFDNSNSSDSALVTLNYEIEHYIFGIPQMIFLLIVIALLLVGVTAGYLIMGKYSG